MTNELLTTDTVTHHFIDDTVPCYEAMESFRRHFPLQDAQVSQDGRTMTYRPTATRNARLCAAQALELIEALSLPLQPIIVDSQVMILYTGR